MAALTRCTQFAGGGTMLESEPATHVFSDVIYVPTGDPVSRAGLFDHGRKLIVQSAHFFGANPLATPQRLGTEYSLDTVPDTAPDELYLYGGILHDHFGHFLLSSLSRYWTTLWFEHPSAKILVHSSSDLDLLFAQDWRAAIFAAIGLSRDRFTRLDRPTKIGKIIVPASSFEEENFAHRAYARSCNALGRRLASPWIGAPDPRPVYLSKERLSAGVQRLENEATISSVLERGGVEIVYPESLPFPQQVALWHNRPTIVSFSNSALHTSILAPGQTTINLNYTELMNGNYRLVDQVNGARAQYLRPLNGSITWAGSRGGFQNAFVAHDPVGIAEDILRALEFRDRSDRLRRARSDRTSDDRAGNLALDRPTRQSCHGIADAEGDSPVNGVLTGSAQLRTGHSENSWWEVDLPGPAWIERIRLYNRMDGDRARPGRFSIGLWHGGPFYKVVHRQTEPVGFGGLDGTPFEWIAPQEMSASKVRISLHGVGALELDQVEVIGRLRAPGSGKAS